MDEINFNLLAFFLGCFLLGGGGEGGGVLGFGGWNINSSLEVKLCFSL